MEEYVPGKNSNKRYRDESGLDSVEVFDSLESKRAHTEPNEAPVELELETTHNSSSSNPAGRTSSPEFDEADVDDAEVNSPKVKQIREDILDILDEPEEVTDGVPANQDLDSVIKSFEEEILHPSTQPPHHNSVHLSESQSDLGYLLEASDDELGLPPTFSPENNIDAGSRLRNDTIGFDNELLRYDSSDLGMLSGIMDGDDYGGENDGDYVSVGGLFDYPDPSNFSEFSRLPESLPAL